MSKYRGFSGPYFPVFGLNSEIYGVIFSPNTGKYGPEKPPYLDIYFPISRSVYEGHEDHLCFNNEAKGTDCPFRQGYSTNIIITKYMGYYHSEWQLRMANWDKVNIRISSIHKELINSATDKKTPEPFLSKRNFKVK